MKTVFLTILYFFIGAFGVVAQIDADALIAIPQATTTERNSISSVKEGALIYDTDLNRIFEYTNTGWLELLTTRDTCYLGAFQISAPGSITVSGMPFQPNQISFVAHANVESFNLDSDNGTGNNDRGIDNSFGTMNGFAREDSGSITQQVIYIGSNGNSINDISRFASNTNCIGVRYGNQNGQDLGKITASLTNFTTDGFTINVVYTNGTVTSNNPNPIVDVQPTDVLNEGLVVLYKAYR